MKLFNRQNNNFLSFPIKGYTLTMDFKVTKKLINFLPILDDLILSMGGRIYLAKDALMSELTFKKSYPKWIRFQEVREKYGAKEILFNAINTIRIKLKNILVIGSTSKIAEACLRLWAIKKCEF